MVIVFITLKPKKKILSSNIEGNVFGAADDKSWDSRIFPFCVQFATPFRHGDVLSFKSFFGAYFFYSKEGNPTLDSNFNDSCKFTMQQHGYQFVLIDKDNRKLCSKTSDDTLFDLIRGPAGYYSLLSTNRAYISGDGFGKWVWATNDNNFIQDRSKLHVILHENNTSTEYPKIKLDRPLVPEYESTLYSFDYDPSEETTTQDNNFVEENTQETVEEPVKTTSKQQDNSGEEKKKKKEEEEKKKKRSSRKGR